MECSIVLLILNFICVCLALAGNLASLTGTSWWKSTNAENGLWRKCMDDSDGNLNCDIKSDIFSTDEKHLDLFIVLILLIISCGLIFFSLIVTLGMFCCMKGCWYCGVISSAILLFLGGGGGLAALVYAEVKFEMDFKSQDRGWSNIVGWVGSGLGLVAFIFSTSMCFVKRKRGVPGGNVDVNPASRNGTSITNKSYPLVNRGYQHGY